MKKSRLLGAVCASVFTFSLVTSADAALFSRLDGLAYYDDQLDITWTRDAQINLGDSWVNQVAWEGSLTIGGVCGWRLPSMDVNGDRTIVDCSAVTQAACKDNESGHLFFYGEGTTLGSGITDASQGPFDNVSSSGYWTGTESATDPDNVVWKFTFASTPVTVRQFEIPKGQSGQAWAVHSGDVGAVPVAFIEMDINPNDKKLTKDTETGLLWLDLTETTDLSVNDIANGVGNTWYQDFRYATREVFEQLATNAFAQCGDPTDTVFDFMKMVGLTETTDNGSVKTWRSIGFTDPFAGDPSLAGRDQFRRRVSTFVPLSVTVTIDEDHHTATFDNRTDVIGHYLVK
jgi:hypothetical protein